MYSLTIFKGKGNDELAEAQVDAGEGSATIARGAWLTVRRLRYR